MISDKLTVWGLGFMFFAPLLTVLLAAIILQILGIARPSEQMGIILYCAVGLEMIVGTCLFIVGFELMDKEFENMHNNYNK